MYMYLLNTLFSLLSVESCVCVLFQVVYGGEVTSRPDMMLLTALADHWLHPGGPRKEQGTLNAVLYHKGWLLSASRYLVHTVLRFIISYITRQMSTNFLRLSNSSILKISSSTSYANREYKSGRVRNNTCRLLIISAY